jgi:hypothetical protein
MLPQPSRARVSIERRPRSTRTSRPTGLARHAGFHFSRKELPIPARFWCHLALKVVRRCPAPVPLTVAPRRMPVAPGSCVASTLLARAAATSGMPSWRRPHESIEKRIRIIEALLRIAIRLGLMRLDDRIEVLPAERNACRGRWEALSPHTARRLERRASATAVQSLRPATTISVVNSGNLNGCSNHICRLCSIGGDRLHDTRHSRTKQGRRQR